MVLQQSISLAPTATSILAYGNLESGTDRAIKAAWPSRCARTIVSRNPNATSVAEDANYDLVYEGSQALSITGGRCFVFRQIGDQCPTSVTTQTVQAGDVLRVSLKIRMAQPNQVFQIFTGHYHTEKSSRWGYPVDDSHVVSRTLIKNADEWYKIEAYHTVGDDWTFNGQVLTPKRCNHYHMRFKADSTSSYIMDDVRIDVVGNIISNGNMMASSDLRRGFLANPDFILNHMYWKVSTRDGKWACDCSVEL